MATEVLSKLSFSVAASSTNPLPMVFTYDIPQGSVLGL